VALFGDPVGASLSPAIHNAAFLAAGLDWSYLPFRADAASLPPLFERLKQEGLAGANFTYPCKGAAVSLCATLDDDAGRLRAVNVARVRDGRAEGFNADVYGFAQSLAELGVDADGLRALVLGTGAAARACGVALEAAGAAVTFACRDLTKPRPGVSVHATVIRLEDAAAYLYERRPGLLVNATPLGLRPGDGPPVLLDAIPPACFVYDLNYGAVTALLNFARRRGLAHADGLTMLLHQAARSFELWTGQPAPLDAMRRAAAAEVAKRCL